MLPIVLRPSSHDDHIPTCQRKLLHGLFVRLIVDVSEHKVPWGAEGYTGDTGVLAEKGFRVGVVGNRVGAGGIVVN